MATAPWQEAWQQLAAARITRSQPGLTFTSAAAALARRSRWQEALQILEPGDLGRVGAWGRGSWAQALAALGGGGEATAAMGAAVRSQRWWHALQLFHWMSEQRASPNTVTYNTAVSAAGAGAWQLSWHWLASIPLALLDVIGLNSAIASAGQKRQWRPALCLAFEEFNLRPNVVSYNSMIDACARCRWLIALQLASRMSGEAVEQDVIGLNSALASDWRRGPQLLQRMARNLLRASAVTHTAAFANGLGGLGDRWGRAVAALGRMRGSQVRVTKVSHNAALDACEETGRWRRAQLALAAMQLEIEPDVISYSTFVSACAVASRWLGALEGWRAQLRAGVEPNVIGATSAASALERQGRWQLANWLGGLQLGAWSAGLVHLARLMAKGGRADAVELGTVIRKCEAYGQWELPIHLLEAPFTSPAANAVSFTSAMSACARAGLWEYAMLVFAWMLERGTEITAVPCNAAISACEKGSQWQMALLVVKNMRKMRVQEDLLTYNSAISACARAGHWVAALGFWRRLRRSGRQMSSTGCNGLLAALARGWQRRRAIAVLESMPRYGLRPTLLSYVALESRSPAALVPLERLAVQGLSAFRKKTARPEGITHALAPEVELLRAKGPGSSREVRALLAAVLPRWRQRPQEATRVLNGLAATRCTTLALQVLDVMELAGVEANVFHYSAAVAACEKSSHWIAALQIFTDMSSAEVQPNVFTTSSAISACAGAAQWHRALALLAEAEAWNAVVFGGALSACEKGGQWEVALALLATMDQAQVQADVVCINSATSACEKCARWQAALQLLKVSEARRLGGLVAHNAALSALARKSRWQEALQLLRQLDAGRLRKDAISYNAVIHACAKSGHWELALHLLQHMANGLSPDAISYSGVISACERGPFRERDQAKSWLILVLCQAIPGACVCVCVCVRAHAMCVESRE
ncbi:unnamed protein product [Effrenium voratum]|nr:unnamed protein product [Effrenium voratum]